MLRNIARLGHVAKFASKRSFSTESIKPTFDLEGCKELHQGGKLHEAEDAYKKLLEWNNKKLGDQHVDTLKVIGNLSVLYLRMNKLDIAEKYCRQAIDGFMKHRAHDKYTLGAMSNLAGILSAKKDYEEAEGLYTAVIKSQTSTLGDTHYDTLQSTASLARTIASQGKLELGLEQLRASLAKHQKALGLCHPDSMSLAEDVYFILHELGRLDEAEEMLRISYQQRKEELGENAKVTLEAGSELGAYLHMRGKMGEAEELLTAIFALQRDHVGDVDDQTLATMNRLGALYLATNQLELADKYLSEALEGQLMSLGEDHPDALNTMRKIGMLRSAQGDYATAETVYREMHGIAVKAYGVKEQTTLVALKDVVEAVELNDKPDESIQLQRQLIELLSQIHGASSEMVVKELGVLGMKLSQRKLFEEAENCLQTAYDGYKRFYGDSSSETQSMLAILAHVKADRGDVRNSEVMFRVALDGLKRSLGPDHEEYLGYSLRYAIVLNGLGNYIDAATRGQEVYLAFAKKLGYAHNYTVNALLPYTESLVNCGLPGTIQEALALLKYSIGENEKVHGKDSEVVQRLKGAVEDINKLLTQAEE